MAKFRWTDFIIKLFSPEGRAVYVANDVTDPLPVAVSAEGSAVAIDRCSALPYVTLNSASSQSSRRFSITLPDGYWWVRDMRLRISIANIVLAPGSNPRMTPFVFDSPNGYSGGRELLLDQPLGISAYTAALPPVLPDLPYIGAAPLMDWKLISGRELPDAVVRKPTSGQCNIGVFFDQLVPGDSFDVLVFTSARLESHGGSV